MPAPVAPFVLFALGAALAWMAAEVPGGRAPSVPILRPLAVVALLGVCVVAPAMAYFHAFAGDWTFLYLVDTRRIPSAIDLLLIALDVAALLGGFLLALPHARRRSFVALTALGFAPAAAALAALLVAAGRLGVQGTYAQYHGGFGLEPTAGSSLGYALLWMGALFVAGVALAVRGLREAIAAVAAVAQGEGDGRPREEREG